MISGHHQQSGDISLQGIDMEQVITREGYP